MKELLAKRRKESHKGNYGRVGIIAGSSGMTGASYLTSQSALRTGSGLVYNIIPKSLEIIMSIKLTEVIIRAVDDNGKGYFMKDSIEKVIEEINNKGVLALGPGIGVDKDIISLVKEIIINSNCPIVIDADGINCLSKNIEILKESKAPIIITPHPGEMARLLNKNINEIEEKRKYYAKYISDKYNIFTVLKGHKTIVTSPNGEIYINNTGNPGMATAGSGDVLTGIITSLIGQGLEIFNGTKLGVYLHGLAGDIARDKIGEYGIIASDIVESIPYAIMKTIDKTR